MGFNYFLKYSKEQLDELLEWLVEFQTFQAIGLFLIRVSWLGILINNLWNANMSTFNKWVFGLLFSEYPFAIYLFRELGFNIGMSYNSVLIGVSMVVFVMNGLFNIFDNMVDDVSAAIDFKENNKEDTTDE